MEAIYAEDVSTIIVRDLSRLSRSMIKVANMITKLNAEDVRLITIVEGFDSMPSKYESSDAVYPAVMGLFREMTSRRNHSMEISKWGRMRESYLTKNHPDFLSNLRASGQLDDYL